MLLHERTSHSFLLNSCFVYGCDVDVGIYRLLMKYHHFLVRTVSRPGGSKTQCISM